jgi:hypothetical protein
VEQEITVRETHLNGGGTHCYHRFVLPAVTENGFYRTIRSFSAFFHSNKKRNWTAKRLFSAHRQDEPITFFDPTLPMIQHESLWDFYNYIGYDKKTKKFSEP